MVRKRPGLNTLSAPAFSFMIPPLIWPPQPVDVSGGGNATAILRFLDVRTTDCSRVGQGLVSHRSAGLLKDASQIIFASPVLNFLLNRLTIPVYARAHGPIDHKIVRFLDAALL